MKSYEDFYDKYWVEKLNKFGKDINKPALGRVSVIQSLLPEKKLGKVLDAGCGDGTILYSLKDFYEFQPYGVDISEIALNKAIGRGINAKLADLTEKIPFNNDSFDTVICSEVLEHLFFPERAVQEIHRVAKDDAVIIFSIPNVSYLQNRIQFLFGKSIFFNPKYQASEHIRFWTKDSFFELLRNENFIPINLIGMHGHTVLNKIFKKEEMFSKYLFIKARKSSKTPISNSP